MGRRGALVTLGAAIAAMGTGYLLVENEALPGKSALDRDLGRCDAPAPPAALRAAPGPTVTGDFRSARRRRQVSFAISYPPGYADGARLPVCLALHGFGGDGRQAVSSGGYPQFIAGAVRDGAAPFALVGPDGGGGYWHPHASDDPLGMLVEDLLPVLAQRGLDTDRLAVAGWSMGGYGALLCGLTWPGRFRAIVATSPAVFHSFADAHKVNPGAFDSPDEWRRFDVTARAKEFAGLPLQVAIGAADPFASAVQTFATHLPDPKVLQVSTGCHDDQLWTSVAPPQVRAISKALAA